VRAAEELLARLQIRELDEIDIERIAAHCGLVVVERDLESEEGHVVRGGELGIVCVSRASRLSAKWLFTLAHELAHHLLHSRLDDFERCGARTSEKAHGKHEAAANAFAGELLMPRAMFLAARGSATPTWSDIERLAALFRTSLTATAWRFFELTEEPAAIVSIEAGIVKWRTRTRAFGARIAKEIPVPAGTRAHAIVNGGAAEDGPAIVEARAWDPAATFDSLVEHARKLEPFDVVLSLLAPAL
jgi:Zn-dependent peptidase ImmA (M78 family)